MASSASNVAFDEIDVFRSLCRNDYYFFLQEFWNTVVPDPYIDNWHIRIIAKEMQFLVDWFLEGLKDGHDEKYDYKPYDLIINEAPGSTKSLECSVFFQPWVWTKYPSASVIGSSFQENLSIDLSRKSRMVIKSDKYQKYFPEVQISEDQDAKGKFANVFQGERNSVGNKGGITGRHADFIVIDDPIDPKGSRSEVEMTLANQFIQETLWSRKKNKARTPTILVMQRLHQCLIEGSLVQTNKGRKAIERIVVGDLVLSKTGTSKVLKTVRRGYKGEVVKVCVFGHPDSVSLTPEHPILTKRGWVNGGDLTLEDWIFNSPVNFKEVPKFCWPEIRYAEPPKHPTGNFVQDSVNSCLLIEDLQKCVDLGMSNCDIAEKFGVHRNTVHNAMHGYKIKRIKERHPIQNIGILDNPNFWYVVGLWVAEGSFGYDRRKQPIGVIFTLHKKETYLLDHIFNLFSTYGVPVNPREYHVNSMHIQIWCTQFARFVKRYFGAGAHHKRIPLAMYGLKKEHIAKFIEGWIDGDGCYLQKKQSFGGCSVSHHLTDGISMLLGVLGVPSIITKERRIKAQSQYPNSLNIVGSGQVRDVRFRIEDITWKKMKSTRIPRMASRKIIVDDMGLWRKVKSIEMDKYDGFVYNLQTTDHSFVVSGCCVHNCDPTGMMLDMASRGELRIRHLCFPAVLTDDVKPVVYRKYYKDNLFDPIRLPKKVLDEAALQGEYSYAGQYLQRPVPIGGGMFKVDNIVVKERTDAPRRWVKRVRYWDKAATEGAGCFTVGALLGKDEDQRFWILDVVRGRWDSARRESMIKAVATVDGPDVWIGVEQEAGSGGKDSALMTIQNLAGYRAILDRPTGEKEVRADPFSTQVNAGNVYMVQAPWNRTLLDELGLFPNCTFKDQVDSLSGAFKYLTLPVKNVGGWRKKVKR